MRIAVINSDGKDAPVLAAPDGIDVRLQELRVRAFARTPYDHLLVELAHVDAAETALADGCDALLIDTFGDYAIERIRTVSTVPVVGAGEAGIAEAADGGRRFSIVTVWPESMGWLYRERLANCAGGVACSGVHHVGAEEELDRVGTAAGVKARMIRGEGATVDAIVAACHRAVAQDSSDAVLLGCTCMSPIAAAVQSRCSFPVIDASEAGLRSAYHVVRSGRSATRPLGTQRAGTIPSIIDAWLATGEVPNPDECDVCVFTAPATKSNEEKGPHALR